MSTPGPLDNTEIMHPKSVGLIKSSRHFIGVIDLGTPFLTTVSSVSFVHYPTLGLTAKEKWVFLFVFEKWVFKGLYLMLSGEEIYKVTCKT